MRSTRNFKVLRGSFLCLLLSICLWSTNLDVLAYENTKLIGHRGYPTKYIENTAKGMAGAYRKGFSGVEMDLYEAEDGSLWVFHDNTLDRMTGKKGSIYKLTKSNRHKYRYKNGDMINTLEEVLAKIKGKKRVYIHIKGNGKETVLSEEAQERIAQDLKKYDLENQTILFAGASKMKKIQIENAKIGWYTEETSYSELRKTIQSMKANHATQLVLLNKSQFGSKERGKKLTSYAHKNGIKIGLYKTQTKRQYQYLKSINVDFALSNYYLK